MYYYYLQSQQGKMYVMPDNKVNAKPEEFFSSQNITKWLHKCDDSWVIDKFWIKNENTERVST
jgi:hypothetical protein